MARAATASDVFNAIAEPQPRDILALPRSGERPVTELPRSRGVVDVPRALVFEAFTEVRHLSRDEAVEKYHAIEGGRQTLGNLAACLTENVRKGVEG